MLRRTLIVLSVGLVMVAILSTMALPAFAAKPTRGTVICKDESGNQLHADSGNQIPKTLGPIYGEFNRLAGQLGFQGNECERDLS